MPSFLPKPPSPVLQRGDPLARGLVGAWPFFEGAGAQSLNLVNNQPASLVGAPPWIGSPVGAALSFDATTQYVTTSLVSTSLTFTLGCLFSVNNLFGSAHLIFNGNNSSAQNGCCINQSNADINVGYFGVDGTAAGTGYTTVVANRLYFAVATCDGTTTKLYVDGAFVSSKAQTPNQPVNAGTAVTRLAADSAAANKLFGKIAGGMIYNRALSAAEVAQLYQDPFRLYRPRSRLSRYAVQAQAAAAASKGAMGVLISRPLR